MPTYQETLLLDSPADARASIDALKDTFEASARVAQLDERPLRVSSGSRLAYRLFGVMLGSNVPVQLRFEILPDDGPTRVVLTMSSDAGWYLVGTTIAEQTFRRRFAEITERLSERGFTVAR